MAELMYFLGGAFFGALLLGGVIAVVDRQWYSSGQFLNFDDLDDL